MLAAFETTDKKAISKIILDKGEVQISELERQALYDGLVSLLLLIYKRI
jgi:ribosome maturation protein Sdo1